MLLDNRDLPIVDMDFMNEVHYEDIKIINDLFEKLLNYELNKNEKNENILNSAYKHWFEHTVEHFKGEETMMLEKQFPPYQMHKNEHDNALKLMQDKFNLWKQTKDINILKIYLIQEVPVWFKNHISSMDKITASFFKTGAMVCH